MPARRGSPPFLHRWRKRTDLIGVAQQRLFGARVSSFSKLPQKFSVHADYQSDQQCAYSSHTFARLVLTVLPGRRLVRKAYIYGQFLSRHYAATLNTGVVS